MKVLQNLKGDGVYNAKSYSSTFANIAPARCVCAHSIRTHRVVCMPEAAEAMSDYAGSFEDNVVFSQQLDGNTEVCLLHPEEHTPGT